MQIDNRWVSNMFKISLFDTLCRHKDPPQLVMKKPKEPANIGKYLRK
jgi:hypothetical protein